MEPGIRQELRDEEVVFCRPCIGVFGVFSGTSLFSVSGRVTVGVLYQTRPGSSPEIGEV
jgi:hypothetical protein